MPKLNWKIILYNIAEAREQLEQIEDRAKGAKKPDEAELQVMLEHAYHHLNFAWNIRHASTARYRNLSDEDFNECSKFPKDMEESEIDVRSKPKGRKRGGA
jgi:hypothetical protein